MPDNVLSIESYSFTNATTIETLKVGEKVNNISPLFKYSNYSGQVSISEGNNNYRVEDNVLYNKDKTKLIVVLFKIIGQYSVDNNITTIGDYAFIIKKR